MLERRLNAAAPGRFEVLNCGRRGDDFPALYDAFREVLRHDPDIVVYGMVLNDAYQIARASAPASPSSTT